MPRREKWTPSPQGARLAELAFQVREGRFDALRRIVEAQGGSWEVMPDGTQVARGLLCTAGFAPGLDPCTALVQIGFALFGQFWTAVPAMGEALKVVNATDWSKP